MSVIPGDVDADAGPPMTIPLRHFLVGLGFLVTGGAVGVLAATGTVSGRVGLAHVHLLLAGWVCVTILGAMTQFVPVWSNAALYSRRLSTVALWLVALGVAGMAWSFASGALAWVHAFGGFAALGFWTFAYNLGRTLLGARPWDVTERHFALALAYFLVVPALGLALAMSYAMPVFPDLPVTRTGTLTAHATLAVFGIVLTTILGALYQLATMFTQTELHGVDRSLRRVEEVGFPVGVVALAGGRLVDSAPAARVGAALVVVSLLAFSVILARRLVETKVEWTPMLARYAVVAPAMALWALLAASAWVVDPVALVDGRLATGDPLAYRTLFGHPDAAHLLAFGVVGFVVLGTLYHVVPFLVWTERYADRLGLEAVPTLDDLYDDRVALVDFALTGGGAALWAGGALAGVALAVSVGTVAFACGGALAAANLARVVWRHSPGALAERFARERDAA